MRTWIAAALLALSLPQAGAAPSADRPAALKQFFTDMGLDKIKDVRFTDSSGKPVTGDEYVKLLGPGARPTVSKQMGSGKPSSAVVSVLAKGDKGPQSLPFKLDAGEAFPAFRLKDAGGAMVDNAALKGRYTVINTYFALCPPCVKEVPELNALQRERADLRFVGLTFDSLEETRAFVAERQFGWTLLPAAKALLAEIGVNSYPSFMILDRDGKVLAIERHDVILARDKSIAAWVKRLVPVKPV